MNKLNTDRTMKRFKAMKGTILRKVANTSVNYFQNDVFDSEGSALGSRWPSGEKKRGKTLVRTGAGKRSINARISGDKATIKADAPYMKHHQRGDGSLPKRKYLGKSRALDKKVHKVIVNELGKL